MIEHVVCQGDCVASVGPRYGVPWKKVWDDPDNEALKEKRKSANVLMPGDVLYVNDQDKKEEPCATEARHRFVKKDDRVWLRLKMLDEGEARSGEKWALWIEGRWVEGTTDGDGKIEVKIPFYLEEAVLRMGGKDGSEDYALKIGELDPETEASGAQARLANLGYGCEVTGRMDADTRRAVKEFQAGQELKATGDLDDQTRGKLVEGHGS